MPLINKTLLVSGADYFSDKDAINALMDANIPVDLDRAKLEHQIIVEAFKSADIKVIKIEPPKDCQDGIYTANWGLVRNGKVVLSRLPNKRKAEEPYAKRILQGLGFQTIELPPNVRAFSGQGDALIVDDVLFVQSPFRTSADAHAYLKQYLGVSKLVALKTKPARLLKIGPAKKNKLTGWPDSPTYDLDLALAILKPKTAKSKPLIAYCPAVFKSSSRRKLARLKGFNKIRVSKTEAMNTFALNLVSTGDVVILNGGAPKFKAELTKNDLKVIELNLLELKKGGGSIRCSSLTLD